MRIATRVAGAAGAAVLGVMALGSTAFADSADNDGVNVLNDNNIRAVPIQACGNDIGAVLGFVIKAASASSTNCVNAPVVEHPHQEG